MYNYIGGNMKTGFLIINYNDYESTIHLINNIKDYKIIDKIVVVDNCSTDDSFNKLKKIETKKIEIIKTLENKGYGYAINYGSRHLIKLYNKCNIIVSNADIIIKKEEDLIKLINDFNNDIGIVAPVINEHGNLSKGWKIPSPLIDCLLNLVYIHRIFRKKYLLYPENYYNHLTDIEVMSGCFFIINSDILREVGFFDEQLFLYYEENVIATKLKKINKRIVIDNDVEIIHNHSVSIDKSLNKIKKYKQLKKSQYYFQTKYNNANILEKLLLIITNKLSLFILTISYKIKDIIK